MIEVQWDLTWNNEIKAIKKKPERFTVFLDVFLTFHVMIFNDLWIKWIIVSTYTWVNTHQNSYLHFFPSPQFSESLCKIEQGNHYKREKTAWNFLFQMTWYTFIRKKQKKEERKNTRNSWRARADLCKHKNCDVHTHKHLDVPLQSIFNLNCFSAF